MVGFICFIALIAIIFGISLHNAFLGVISFAGLMLLSCLVFVALGSSATKLLNWLNKPREPKTEKKKLTRKEIEAKRKSALNILILVTVVAIIFAVAAIIWSLLLYGDISLGFGY